VAPRLPYVVTEDWYFLSHRLPMARAAQEAGYEVHVATRLKDGKAAIEQQGFVPHGLNWSRGSLSPRARREIGLLCPPPPVAARAQPDRGAESRRPRLRHLSRCGA